MQHPEAPSIVPITYQTQSGIDHCHWQVETRVYAGGEQVIKGEGEGN